MNKEIEIKIEIDKKLFIYFTKGKSFQYEKTYGYFTDNYENMGRGVFPRIKTMGNTSLVSVKVKIKETKMFERDEYEFEIETHKIESVRSMFRVLGYSIEHIFEKKRYKLKSINECEFVVDELPFGYFIELEGEEKNIEKSIEELKLQDNEKINGAYLKLWEKYKKDNNLSGECLFS